MKKLALLMILFLAVSFVSCGTIEVDGFKVSESKHKRTVEIVANRAAFEMSCPKDKLKMKILNVDSYGDISSIGVSGCNQKLVYVLVGSNYVLNSDSKKDSNK